MTSKKGASKNRVPNNKSLEKSEGISYSTLLLVFISLVSGSLFTLLVMKIFSISSESFTSSELISFLFGIALSAASTVLAIVAISLGKSSEQAMMDRSDESIKIQNEVFVKTIEALQRIESSTGVTEKRIEDIISGRAGAISDKIAEKLIEDRGIKSKNKAAIRKDVQQSIFEGLSSQESEIKDLKREELVRKLKEESEKRSNAEQEYQKFHNEVLLGLANSKKMKTIKIGDGAFDETGDNLFDGVFEVKAKRVAVSTFTVNKEISDQFDGFYEFLSDVARELSQNSYQKVYLVFNDQLTQGDQFYSSIEKFRSLIKDDIAKSIIDLQGAPEDVVHKMISDIETTM